MNKNDLKKLIGHKPHKYGAKRTICNLGHSHPSKAEAMHCWALSAQLKANTIRDLEYEKTYELKVNGILVATHKPDFIYLCLSKCGIWKICVDEVKGFKTADWILKSKLFQALYPNIKYRVVE